MEQYEAFDRVYDATRDPLLRWLIPRVRSGDDVEDLMQEIYKKLYRKMCKGGVREPERYVFGIAKKELARFYRRRAVVQNGEVPMPESLPCEEEAPEDVVLDREREREIWALVKAEPLQSYQAFTLYYGFSVPTETIAKELGMTEDAVRRRLSRIRARIRQLLSQQNDAAPAEERKGV